MIARTLLSLFIPCVGVAAAAGLGGIVEGTDFGAPLGVALNAPRAELIRGSALVAVFNLGLAGNIRPGKRHSKFAL